MTTPTWHERVSEALAFLAFWGPLPDDTYGADRKVKWEREVRRDLGSRDDDTLDAFAARWQARYDEIEATRGTITGRAGSLLLFVGVLTTGAGLIAPALSAAPALIVALFIIVGLLLLYSGVAAAVLAVRAQRVGQWDSPRIDVADAVDRPALRLKYATEIYVAAEQNRLRLRRPVGMLRDAQLFAMGGIIFIALLAVLSVTAAIAKSPAPAATPVASPAPSAAASPSRPAPATPSISRGSNVTGLIVAGRHAFADCRHDNENPFAVALGNAALIHPSSASQDPVPQADQRGRW
jgi:hypothetical protein